MNKYQHLNRTSLGFGVLKVLAIGAAVSLGSPAQSHAETVSLVIDQSESGYSKDFGTENSDVTFKNGGVSEADQFRAFAAEDGRNGRLSIQDVLDAVDADADSVGGQALVRLLDDKLNAEGTASVEDVLAILPAPWAVDELASNLEGLDRDDFREIVETLGNSDNDGHEYEVNQVVGVNDNDGSISTEFGVSYYSDDDGNEYVDLSERNTILSLLEFSGDVGDPNGDTPDYLGILVKLASETGTITEERLFAATPSFDEEEGKAELKYAIERYLGEGTTQYTASELFDALNYESPIEEIHTRDFDLYFDEVTGNGLYVADYIINSDHLARAIELLSENGTDYTVYTPDILAVLGAPVNGGYHVDDIKLAFDKFHEIPEEEKASLFGVLDITNEALFIEKDALVEFVNNNADDPLQSQAIISALDDLTEESGDHAGQVFLGNFFAVAEGTGRTGELENPDFAVDFNDRYNQVFLNADELIPESNLQNIVDLMREGDYDLNVELSDVQNVLGTPSGSGYTIEEVKQAILSVHITNESPVVEGYLATREYAMLELTDSNGLLDIDDFKSVLNEKIDVGTSLDPFFAHLVEDDGSLRTSDAVYLHRMAKQLQEISFEGDTTKTEVEDVLEALPTTWTVEEVTAFQSTLNGLANDDGYLTTEAAYGALETALLANPGTDLERVTDSEGIFDTSEDYNTNGIEITGQGDLSLTNEVEVDSGDRGIVIISGTDNAEDDEPTLTGKATLINHGDVESNGTAISAAGTAVDITNTGEINSNYQEGITVYSEGDIVVSNTGEITAGAAVILHDENAGYRGESGIRLESHTGKIEFTNSGNIESTGRGIQAGTLGVITGVNSGVIETSLDSADGIKLSSGANGEYDFEPHAGDSISLTNSGFIATQGDDAEAIKLRNFGGDITLVNSGDLETEGYFAEGLALKSGDNIQETDVDGVISYENYQAFSGGDIDLDNEGDIETYGIRSEAILVASFGGNLDIENSGDLTTEEEDSLGIFLETGSARNSTGYVLFDGGDINLDNSGDIKTKGEDAEAIRAWSNGGALTVTNTGKLTTKSIYARGIQLSSGGTFKDEENSNYAAHIGGDIELTNDGIIDTTGEGSDAIKIWSNGGDVTTVNHKALTTKGKGARGIALGTGDPKSGEEDDGYTAFKGGTVDLTNHGDIKTSGEEAVAIRLTSTGGNIVAVNNGSLDTTGKSAQALAAYTGSSFMDDGREVFVGGTVDVTNNGDINTAGDKSIGMRLWSNGGAVTGKNTGYIGTSGDDYAHAIAVYSGEGRDGYVAQAGGEVSITNEGEIQTSGLKSDGIHAGSNGGKVTIKNIAKITTAHSMAIHGFSIGGDVIVNNEGVLNGGAAGIVIADFDEDDEPGISTKTATINNKGAINVDATDGMGLLAIASENATINNISTVDVKGQAAITSLGLTSAKVDNSGAVTLTRDWSEDGTWNPAIGLYSLGGVDLKNTGDVTTIGERMYGVGFGGGNNIFTSNTSGAGSSIILNDAKIETAGVGSIGLYGKLFGDGEITNSGSIITNGAANAVELKWQGPGEDGAASSDDGAVTTSSVAFVNSGTIDAKNGLAYLSNGLTDNVTNTGQILGGASFGAQDDTLANKGVLVGAFDFGEGEDTLKLTNTNAPAPIHDLAISDIKFDIPAVDFSEGLGSSEIDGSDISNATFDGGAGEDSVDFKGGGEIVDNQFTNFETANLLSGNFSGSGINSFNKEVNIDGGFYHVGVDDKVNIVGDLNVKDGGLYIGVTSTEKHGLVDVGGNAKITQTSMLKIAVSQDHILKLEDGVDLLSADNIDFLDVADETKKSFKLSDNYVALDFDGQVIDDGEGRQVLKATVVERLSALVDIVEVEIAKDLKRIISFVEAETKFLDAQQQKIVDFIHTQLAAIEDDDGEKLNAIVEELSTNQSTQGLSATQQAGINTAVGMLKARLDARVSTSSSSNVNSYAPENQEHGAIRHINAMVDEGNEGSMNISYSGQTWAQLYGGRLSETRPSSAISGSNWGGAIGVDNLFDDNSLAGLAFIFSDSNSSSSSKFERAVTDSQTFGLSGYAGRTLDTGTGFSGAIGYYRSSHEGARTSDISGKYKSKYNSNSFVVRGDVSQAIELDQVTFTPQASLTYSRTHNGGYVESGTGSAPKTINSFNTQSLLGSLGASLSTVMSHNGMTFSPEGHVNALYEFNDVLGSYSGSLAGITGTNFSADVTTNTPLKWNVGGSVKIQHSNNFSSNITYDGIFSSNSAEHMLKLKGSYKY